jgi:two-component system CheB/CheR fusion protein
MRKRKQLARNRKALLVGRAASSRQNTGAVAAGVRHKEKPQPPPSKKPVSFNGRFPIAGIGASAGGLEALEELLAEMPADIGMAFVVVIHQHPGHTSLLPDLLSKVTRLPVVKAADHLKVERNHVYVNPPGGNLAILNGVLHLMEPVKEEGPRLSIDYFLRSLAKDQKERAICIVLSGTGTDGTLGLKAIKGESGMAMVQQVQSAKYAGMPSSAVATGLADYILPPEAMPQQLAAYVRGPYLTATPAAETAVEVPALAPEPLQKIFVLLRSRTGHDFSAYKPSTIRRRVERRMNVHQIDAPNQYLRYLQENPQELDALFKELLISVTSFFRDLEAFESLAQSLLPNLLESRPDNQAIRFWVPGCATGEEVFSLAMILRECMDKFNRRLEVQLFGTDLDSDAIEAARAGLYPEGIAVDVSSQRLERFFTREDGSFRIRKEIREMAIFAVQNVIRDPPFTKLDLLSCRNMLIYLNSDLQRRLVPVFHYALKPGGLLMLGPSENIGGCDELFEVVDKKWKIFRRKESPQAPYAPPELPRQPAKTGADKNTPATAGPAKEASLAAQVNQLLLTRFAPAAVVVNDRGDMIFIHGRTGDFLEPATGQPRLNILDMAREGLQLELASALRQAAARNTEVIREGVRFRSNGGFLHASFSVTKLHEPEALRGLLLVAFRLRPGPAETEAAPSRPRKQPMSDRADELERELLRTKESLQTTIEELETSNEELKSANEELQSTNEELQSTIEELETSKEEMQSLNEELTTVNTELQSKVEELSRAHDDMQNLLNNTEIATLFLDNELRIKRFTEQARSVVKVIPTDIGRPLGDLASSLCYDGLAADCREVLRTLTVKEAEVHTHEGHFYLMRIIPYRTAENTIDGLVLTFVDIHPIKEAQKNLRRMSQVFTEGRDPIIIVDTAGRMLDVNDEAARVCGWSRQELLGQPIAMIVPQDRQEEMANRLRLCKAGEALRNLECVWLDKPGRVWRAWVTFSLLTNERGGPEAISMITKQVNP